MQFVSPQNVDKNGTISGLQSDIDNCVKKVRIAYSGHFCDQRMIPFILADYRDKLASLKKKLAEAIAGSFLNSTEECLALIELRNFMLAPGANINFTITVLKGVSFDVLQQVDKLLCIRLIETCQSETSFKKEVVETIVQILFNSGEEHLAVKELRNSILVSGININFAIAVLKEVNFNVLQQVVKLLCTRLIEQKTTEMAGLSDASYESLCEIRNFIAELKSDLWIVQSQMENTHS